MTIRIDETESACNGPQRYQQMDHRGRNCSISVNDRERQDCALRDRFAEQYRKYGETSTVSQSSKYGIFRAGLWYEWATSNRFQIPSDPLTGQDQSVPNFHENYWTNSYNPYAEFQWHATQKLTVTVGDKYAIYTLDFKQFADNGKVVGNLNGAPFTTSSGSSGVNLPSASANFRLASNWSVYGQYGKGDEIPPTSVFDVTGGGQEVSKIPTPQLTNTYQFGTVVKLNRLTLDADYFHVKFQNNYIPFQVANPNNPGFDLNEYFLGPDSFTQGFEAEAKRLAGLWLQRLCQWNRRESQLYRNRRSLWSQCGRYSGLHPGVRCNLPGPRYGSGPRREALSVWLL